MTSADVRTRLTAALALDLIGPDADSAHASEVIDRPPSRWYLTGFLAPWNAPKAQKQDDDAEGELELTEPTGASDEDANGTPEPPAARRGMFTSSIGLSVLVPASEGELRVTVCWGDYAPVEKDGAATGEWRRRDRSESLSVPLPKTKTGPTPHDVPGSGGLQVVVSIRAVREDTLLRDLPARTQAVSVFVVNRRPPGERDDLKDTAFAFQVGLTVEAERPFVPRPNPRGRDGNDADERIADLQYRDVMEYAVGHGVSTRGLVSSGTCNRVDTTWMPGVQVERVEAAVFSGVELGMRALADAPDARAIRDALRASCRAIGCGLPPRETPRRGPAGRQRSRESCCNRPVAPQTAWTRASRSSTTRRCSTLSASPIA